jgi:hypothetical protein
VVDEVKRRKEKVKGGRKREIMRGKGKRRGESRRGEGKREGRGTEEGERESERRVKEKL